MVDKEMFYLMTNLTHFIYGYVDSDIWYIKVMLYLMTHSTHFIYDNVLSDIWQRKEMFYLMMHSTHFIMVICYTSHGALDGKRNSSYGKGPFSYQERKPGAATTWATLSD